MRTVVFTSYLLNQRRNVHCENMKCLQLQALLQTDQLPLACPTHRRKSVMIQPCVRFQPHPVHAKVTPPPPQTPSPRTGVRPSHRCPPPECHHHRVLAADTGVERFSHAPSPLSAEVCETQERRLHKRTAQGRGRDVKRRILTSNPIAARQLHRNHCDIEVSREWYIQSHL